MQKLLISSTIRFNILSLSSSTLTNSFHYYHTIGGLLFLVVPVSYVAETVAQKCLKYLDEILQHVPDIAIFPIKRSNHYKIALSQFPKAPMGTKATPHSNSISVCNVRILILSWKISDLGLHACLIWTDILITDSSRGFLQNFYEVFTKFLRNFCEIFTKFLWKIT